MRLIEQSYSIINIPPMPLALIELAGRTCYKSEDKITKDSAEKFVKMLMDRGHESVLEHVNVTVRFITNRGVTHELIRHRLASFSQESTRYVKYKHRQMEFIKPVWLDESTSTQRGIFIRGIDEAMNHYDTLVAAGWRAEQAREVLPNALKTEIVVTANLREWLHIFNLRTSKKAHPQIRALMLDCLEGFKEYVPVVFDSVGEGR